MATTQSAGDSCAPAPANGRGNLARHKRSTPKKGGVSDAPQEQGSDAVHSLQPALIGQPCLDERADAELLSIAPEDYVPTDSEIKSELWRIATGEGSEASRVSALRALADIMGLMRTAPPELPEAMSAIMDALSQGLSRPPVS